jgi:hypothetical protein
MALWRFLETGELPEGATLKTGEELEPCGVTPRSGCWWREPVGVQGLLSKPSWRWGRLLWPASCRRKTQKASGDGCSSPHGEKLVGDAGLNANGSHQPIEAQRCNASAKPGAARGQRTGQAGPAELCHDIENKASC